MTAVKKRKQTAELLLPCNELNRFSHHAVTAFYFTLKALFFTTKCYFHHVLYVFDALGFYMFYLILYLKILYSIS